MAHETQFYSSQAPAYYIDREHEVNTSGILTKPYAPSTLRAIGQVKDDWERYCSLTKRSSASMLESLDAGAVYVFLEWRLQQTQNAKGRNLRRFRQSSSLDTYWKHFLQFYSGATKRRLDAELMRNCQGALSQLVTAFRLSNAPPAKAPMDVEDVTEHVRTILTTTRKMFKIGRSRLQNICFVQGGFITANRTDALLRLQYKHIQVSFMRRDDCSPPRILLEFTYEFTKTFLGPKAPNTFPIPEILFDASLVLSPQVFYLGLMFHDRVFLNNITPENIFSLTVPNGLNQLTLPMKPEKREQYVLRDCKRTANGYQTTEHRLSDHILRYDIKKCGEIAGFKLPVIPRNLRYGSGSVSDALQNMILMHSNMNVFVQHYLSRRVTVDTQAIVRGLKPQNDAMRAACRMSRFIDPKRPTKLTPEENATVDEDPRVQILMRRRNQCKLNKEQHTAITKLLRTLKQRLKKEKLETIRNSWDDEAAEKHIDKQLFDAPAENERRPLHEPVPSLHHVKLIQSILCLPGKTPDEEIERRSTAMRAILDYCDIEEGETWKQDATRGPQVDVGEVLESDMRAIFDRGPPFICPDCIGNRQRSAELRKQEFSTYGSLCRHYKSKHIELHKQGCLVKCWPCDATFETVHDKRRHASRVHHIK